MIALLVGCVFITAADIADKQRDPDVIDGDGDGYAGAVDCDDADADVHPGATERPNGGDDDCDGHIDQGTVLADDDGDGFCEEAPCSPDCEDCSVPAAGDCDDADVTVFPGAPEICDRQKNDCDVDYGEDDDHDGDGWTIRQGDPDDRDRSAQPSSLDQALASITCAVGRVEAATFAMGCAGDDCPADQTPVHDVTLPEDLLVMQAEVTREQWGWLVSSPAWPFSACADTCPATGVSWEAAQDFADALNDAVGLPRCDRAGDPRACTGWRLPTEAEWEYAARGDRSDPYAGSSTASSVAWTRENAGGTPHPVRAKAPNWAGLYDLSGNAQEWTWDVFQYYGSDAVIDPVPLVAVSPPEVTRSLRGGDGHLDPSYARVWGRNNLDATQGFDGLDDNPENPYNWIGFRLVRRAP